MTVILGAVMQLCASSTFQFADDTTLATANPALSVVAENLTTSFYATKEFCDSHKLNINPQKTQLIVSKKNRKIHSRGISAHAGQLYHQT